MVLRAALIGAGEMGKNHARILSSLTGVELVAVVDQLGDPHGIRGDASLLSSVSDLKSMSVDFAVVATPTSTHEDVATWLFEAGINALIEKPLAIDAESAKSIFDVAEANGCLGAVGLVERFNPAIRQLKERLEAGAIGNVLQIATRRQGSFPNRIGDVGVTKDLGSHDIDLAMWISGERYSRIFAQATHKSGRVYEDMITVSGALEGGTIVNHIVNWLSPMKERLVVVTGEAGVFFADTVSGDLILHENGVFAVEWDSFASFRGVTEGNMTRFAYPKKEPLRAELEGFRDAVLGNGSEIASLAEGVEVAKVADAILRSAGSNAVEFP